MVVAGFVGTVVHELRQDSRCDFGRHACQLILCLIDRDLCSHTARMGFIAGFQRRYQLAVERQTICFPRGSGPPGKMGVQDVGCCPQPRMDRPHFGVPVVVVVGVLINDCRAHFNILASTQAGQCPRFVLVDMKYLGVVVISQQLHHPQQANFLRCAQAGHACRRQVEHAGAKRLFFAAGLPRHHIGRQIGFHRRWPARAVDHIAQGNPIAIELCGIEHLAGWQGAIGDIAQRHAERALRVAGLFEYNGMAAVHQFRQRDLVEHPKIAAGARRASLRHWRDRRARRAGGLDDLHAIHGDGCVLFVMQRGESHRRRPILRAQLKGRLQPDLLVARADRLGGCEFFDRTNATACYSQHTCRRQNPAGVSGWNRDLHQWHEPHIAVFFTGQIGIGGFAAGEGRLFCLHYLPLRVIRRPVKHIAGIGNLLAREGNQLKIDKERFIRGQVVALKGEWRALIEGLLCLIKRSQVRTIIHTIAVVVIDKQIRHAIGVAIAVAGEIRRCRREVNGDILIPAFQSVG